MQKIKFVRKRVEGVKDNVALFSCQSVEEAAQLVNVHKKNIYRAISRSTLSGGFNWRYAEANLPGEIWKRHYSGYYVSNKGRTYSSRGKTFGCHRKGGYMVVYDGSKMMMVHRMVMQAFKPTQQDLLVDHIDGVKHNNKLENLRWVTAKENAENRKPREKFKHCDSCSCIL